MFNVIELGIPGTHAGLNKVTCFYLRRLANDPTRTVWLNEILDFYTEDFVPVPADDLIDDADRYAPRGSRSTKPCASRLTTGPSPRLSTRRTGPVKLTGRGVTAAAASTRRRRW